MGENGARRGPHPCPWALGPRGGPKGVKGLGPRALGARGGPKGPEGPGLKVPGPKWWPKGPEGSHLGPRPSFHGPPFHGPPLRAPRGPRAHKGEIGGDPLNPLNPKP